MTDIAEFAVHLYWGASRPWSTMRNGAMLQCREAGSGIGVGEAESQWRSTSNSHCSPWVVAAKWMSRVLLLRRVMGRKEHVQGGRTGRPFEFSQRKLSKWPIALKAAILVNPSTRRESANTTLRYTAREIRNFNSAIHTISGFSLKPLSVLSQPYLSVTTQNTSCSLLFAKVLRKSLLSSHVSTVTFCIAPTR